MNKKIENGKISTPILIEPKKGKKKEKESVTRSQIDLRFTAGGRPSLSTYSLTHSSY
jgi:hypothetical protein